MPAPRLPVPAPELAQLVQAIERALLSVQTIVGLPTHADDTAAGTAGLTEGRLYKTATGQLMVKL
jgi:hypothetical protein